MTPTPPRFTRDEQAFAVWLSHTVIPIAVTIIALLGYGSVPVGFLILEAVIWLMFSALLPYPEGPANVVLRMLDRDEYLIDAEAVRRRVLPAGFAIAFVLQFAALTFLLRETGGPITSPFGSFVVAYAVFSSLLTTQLWSLGVTLLAPTLYYAAMVVTYGFGEDSDRASVEIYLAVTLLIVWLTVWLAFLSRLSAWRLQSSMNAEADLATLRAAVATQIWNRTEVWAGRLPARRPAAAAALAEYMTEHPELALRMADGRRLEWIERERMRQAHKLTVSFEPERATELFATSLGLAVREVPRDTRTGSRESVMVGALGDDAVLPSHLLIRALAETPSPKLLKDTAKIARREIAGANVAVLLVPDASEWMSQPTATSAQRDMATSVVVLDAQRLLRLAGAKVARRALMTAVREQADLTKANPFVLEGPTPPSMFFGRSHEEASITALLRDNSAALLGGRRTGKTSLLQRIQRTLTDEGWQVLYVDLHPVGDWASFAELISLQWDIDVPPEFRPSLMANAVHAIRERHGDAPLVIMFDEVDLLLKWDQQHADPFVPEAFFRSCRALSQEGDAQFVLAGERAISERIWSPDSPHWNFCRPVRVRQLGREDADQLLVRSLQHLEVEIDGRETFLDHAWRHTSGHPQLVQYLGVSLVERLNERDPDDRSTLSAEDLMRITDTDRFRQHYITTYQGQANALEKSLCNLAATGATSVERLSTLLEAHAKAQDNDSIRAALRMLDLYGIVDITNSDFTFRAEWMPEALRETSVAGTLDPGLNQ